MPAKPLIVILAGVGVAILLIAMLFGAIVSSAYRVSLTESRQEPAQNVPAVAAADIPDSPYWTDADRWVDVAGLRTRVRIEGADDAPALILIHGFSVSLESFDAWAADLATDYRVIRPDLPGHGLTGPDPESRYSVPQTADFVGGLMDTLGIDTAIIGGNSLGGLAAWRFAADHPDRVTALVLVAPGGYSINGVTEEPVAVPAPVAAYLLNAPAPFVAAATAQLYGDPSRLDPAVSERIAAMMARDGNGAAMVARLEVFTLPEPGADLARITAPTLILHGGADRMIPLDHSRQMSAAIPNARLVTHDDLGHVPHQEDPQRTLGDVRNFLSEVTP
ncbi:alpha/beta fold hydrolase [Hyphobacterium marinum]|uniref:Alpha/beta hydrolase n=1 Tax=Hyphobacterium marinum TaxID=3116574 RepID=A0ABU7LVU3_9PROT|nr:alpha/beta hydrolase [Hyphobacterium sp. Y6023]MEE2565678.1 alpha/beta hydrolase [Hyphobacterium sp. Y6023]